MKQLKIVVDPSERTLNVIEKGCDKARVRLKSDAIARIGSEIAFDKRILDTYHYDGWKSVHHDLLVVCAAVEFADRKWARGNTHWARKFHIVVPVVELGVWRDESIGRQLCTTLRHLTGDEWRFSFVKWEGDVSEDDRQRPLFFDTQKEFAIAYSDGLDSRSVSGIFNKNDVAVRVRVAKGNQKRRKNELPFDRIPFDVRVFPSQEDSARSRGFKFAAITAIAAHLSGLNKIIVPESGQGALGPVLVPLYNIYADYRNHPTFFRRMERFIKALLGHEITFDQPRLWRTKGQTIIKFLEQPGIDMEQVLHTRSCWQQRHNVRLGGIRRQCGVCAACMLRRTSLHAANVSEKKETYVISDLTATNYSDALPRGNTFNPTKTLLDYGIMGARHMQQLADMAALPSNKLRNNSLELAESLGATEEETLRNLRNLLARHAEEWQRFLTDQGQESFLRVWTKGGRYDRS